MDLKTETLEFERFQIDFSEGSLSRIDEGGRYVPVAIGGRAFDVLSVLVCHPGAIVPKHEIMDAVWPGLEVEEGNLTVQMSALRRVLDRDRTEGSCIQTISGRGYRFLPEIRRHEPSSKTVGPPYVDHVPLSDRAGLSPLAAQGQPSFEVSRSSLTRRWYGRRSVAFATAGVACIGLVILLLYGIPAKAPPPRLSIAVLSFSNLDGTPNLARLADGISEDLTIDLAQLSDAPVSPRQSVLRFKERAIDERAGRELNVRYILMGSLRRIGPGVRTNVALMSGETGVALWVDQLDVGMPDGVADQEEIVSWLRNSVIRQLTTIEAARSARERPDNLDASDLVLQARALQQEPPSTRRGIEAQALFEQALRLDPASVAAMTGLATTIMLSSVRLGASLTGADLDRVQELIAAGESIEPTNVRVLWTRAELLRVQQRWPEAAVAFEHVLSVYPHFDGAVEMLGVCKVQLGESEDAIPLFQKLIRDDPHNPDIWSRYVRLGQAFLLIGRYDEAVHWTQRSLAAGPEQSSIQRSNFHANIASAYALAGHIDRAREEVAEANAIWPYLTVHSLWAGIVANERFAAQTERVREGVRMAGLRDHVNEDEDFGIVPDSRLRTEFFGKTPLTVPGATTIRTPELAALLNGGKPVVIDASQGNRTLAGAISLYEGGLGGSLQDSTQDRLRSFMQTITGGDRSRPIVALSINAERWAGYNLALRLTALGYRHVYWYRGGREAWEVAGLVTAQAQITAMSTH
jgi:adenylate cyclase